MLILFIFHCLICKNIVGDICQSFSRYPDTHSVTFFWPFILMGLSWRKERMAHIAPRPVSFRLGLSDTLKSSVFLYLHVGVHSVSEISGKNKLSVSKLSFLPLCFQSSWSPREIVSDGRDTAALVTSLGPRVAFPMLFRLICLPWQCIWRCIRMGAPAGQCERVCPLINTKSTVHVFSLWYSW